jgi:signal transduction histidine kinase
MADSVITQREDAATIKQQSSKMADQVDALCHMTTERDESATRAARLQVALNKHTLEMREKEELLALVLNVSVDGVLIYRTVQADDGTITNFQCVLNNPAAEKIYGTDSLVGRDFLDLHQDVSAKGLWKNYVQVVESGGPFEVDYCYDLEKPVRWFRVLGIKVAGGIAITLSDISQRKRLEAQILAQLEELKQADEMKNQFLGIISHELRTPLNAIMGFASIIEDEVTGPLNDSQRFFMSKVSVGADMLLSLVDDLLDMSRIQAGKFSVEPRLCEFRPIVAETLVNLQSLAGPRVLVNEVPANLPAILADGQRVAQVLTNLIANAIKFTPQDGNIIVRSRVEGAFLYCEVKDTGVGISAEDIPKIFNVFVQLNMSTTRSAGGTGLGLTISKTLVEAHGGAIGVESVADKGSTFWFTLPLAAAVVN